MGRMQNSFDMIEFMARTHIDPFKLGPVNILSMNIVFSLWVNHGWVGWLNTDWPSGYNFVPPTLRNITSY